MKINSPPKYRSTSTMIISSFFGIAPACMAGAG
jgi:hypothetical protein